MLQAMMEACEDRQAARQAEREAAKAAPPASSQASTPAELQQLVQQAVQHAFTAQGGSQATAAAATGPAPEAQAAPLPQVPPAETSEGYCAMHQVWMEQRSNERGSWYSHIATDDEGEYFCKGKGRTRRNGR